MYRFYAIAAEKARPAPALQAATSLVVWRPSWRRIPPKAIRDRTHWMWWLFHNLHVFANRDLAVVMLMRDGKLIHRSGVFPRYFRFPFMATRDLQIGDTWTDPSARRQGLATAAISWCLAALAENGRRFWYVVDESNDASIRVIEQNGFHLWGRGLRLARFGFRALGYFAITERP